MSTSGPRTPTFNPDEARYPNVAPWLKIGLVVLAIVLALPMLQLYMVTHPPKIESGITPERLGLPYEEVRFTTSDDLELAGWWIPAANATNQTGSLGATDTPQNTTTVLVGHGYPAEKGDVLPGVAFLHGDHHLFLFDHRSFGASQGSLATVGLREVRDVTAALDHLENRPEVDRIVGLGFSLSAATMLMASDPRMEALVAEASYAQLDDLIGELYGPFIGPTKWPLVGLTELYARITLGAWPSEVSPEQAIQDTPFPVLLIHGTADEVIPPSHSERLHAAAPEGMSELWLVDGARHGEPRALAGAGYEERVRVFFQEGWPSPRKD